MIAVSVYEDNDSLRESLANLLKGAEGILFRGAHANCNNVEHDFDTEQPGVVLMDIEMPGTNGIEGVKRLKHYAPETEVLMLTVFDDDTNVFQSLNNGASGYILKGTPPSKILEAIHEIFNGGSPMSSAIARRVVHQFNSITKPVQNTEQQLSSREKELLLLLTKGSSYKMIAKELEISVHTVQQHIKHIYSKLHVHNMGEAVAKALKNRII